MIGRFLAFRNFECAAQQLAANLWRKTLCNIFKARRDYGRITAKQSLKSAHGRIKDGMMLFQERDEVAHLRFVRRKLARVLGDFDEAVAVTRFLDLRKKEIQFDKIDICWISSAPPSTNCRADMNAGT